MSEASSRGASDAGDERLGQNGDGLHLRLWWSASERRTLAKPPADSLGIAEKRRVRREITRGASVAVVAEHFAHQADQLQCSCIADPIEHPVRILA